jgi:hypothetical protein
MTLVFDNRWISSPNPSSPRFFSDETGKDWTLDETGKFVIFHKSGKWCIFHRPELWNEISLAVENGALGTDSKISKDGGVICVYVYDGDDYDEVMRVRQRLRDIGVTWKIPYVDDAETRSAASQGDRRRRSRYYE